MIDAYEPSLPNHFVRPIAFIALVIIGVWNLAGWWLSEGPFAYRLLMAALTLMFEVLGANVSAQKARAEQRQVTANVRRYWLTALAMCCCWSVFCAHNALMLFTPDMSDLQRVPAYVVLTAAAFIIPLAPWAIERTEKAALLPASPPRDALVDDDAPTAPPARPPRAFVGPSLREAGKAAMAASVVGAPAAAALPTDWPEPAAQVRSARDAVWRAQARALWVEGERNKSAIARAVGRPRETVRRELRALGA
jgi:hypothetical protein